MAYTSYTFKQLNVVYSESLGNGYALQVLSPYVPAYTIEKDGVRYSVGATAYVEGRGADKTITDIVIASEIDGVPVESISPEAFLGNRDITSIFIPATVTNIGVWAFNDCSSLTNITFGGTISQWDWDAYHLFCDNDDLPVTEIICSDGAIGFVEGSNRDIKYELSDDGTYYTVLSPDLSGIENLVLASYIRGIPVTHISVAAFYDLYDFTSVTLPSALKSIGASAFAYSDIGRSIEIPDSVTYIGDSAFKNTGLTSVVIPEGVTIINAETFMNCYSLASVTIPKSVTSIAQDAFYDCSSLTDVYYSGTEEEWNALDISDGNDVLKNATIHYLVLSGTWKFNDTLTAPEPDFTVQYLDFGYYTPDNTYQSCAKIACPAYVDDPSSMWYSFDENNDSVGASAYYSGIWGNDSYKTIIISEPQVVKKEFYEWFVANATKQATEGLEYTLSTDGTFYSCSGIGTATDADIVIASEVDGIPVLYIETWAFKDCDNLTSVIIPDSVIEIGSEAFYDCDSLGSVVIGAGVTYIGIHALYGCPLMDIKVAQSNSKYASIDGNLYSKDGTELIRYARKKTDTTFTIPDSVIIISDFALDSCGNLMSVTIPSSVTSIGVRAFFQCINLTDVYYAGTEEQWNAISINNVNDWNDTLLNATIHYNYTG